jgi:alpha-ketoglutarate-dependent taurine dioxygenase
MWPVPCVMRRGAVAAGEMDDRQNRHARLRCLAAHIAPHRPAAGPIQHARPTGRPAATSSEEAEGAAASSDELARLFGTQACAEGPLMASGGGLRLVGVDLRPALAPEQAAFLVDALARHRLLCIAGQDVAGRTFTTRHFERFASHFGAVVPHPNNFRTGGAGEYADAGTGSVSLLPVAERRGTTARIPGQIRALAHDSPAVLTLATFGAISADGGLRHPPASHRDHGAGPTLPQPGAGGGFHTDVEYEPVPIAVSMFLVHAAPTARRAPGGTWVADTGEGETAKAGQRFFRQGRQPITAALQQARHALKPLNGETAFIDLAAAFAALPATERNMLAGLQVRRPGSRGIAQASAHEWGGAAYGSVEEKARSFPSTLVRTNARTGQQSLYSPWECRGPGSGPRVVGLSEEANVALLDRLELHCLQPQFRHNQLHTPGDVTLWDLQATLHAVPPIISGADSLEDARLMYRLSTKGEPSLTLPRMDPQAWLDEHVALGYTTPPEVVRV